MKKYSFLLILAALLTSGCATHLSVGLGEGSPNRYSTTTDHLTIRNASQCIMIVDRSDRRSSVVLNPGEKAILRHSLGGTGQRSASIEVAIMPKVLTEECGTSFRPIKRRWSVSSTRYSDQLWVVYFERGNLRIQ